MTSDKALNAMLEQGFSELRDEKFEEAVETFSACHALETKNDSALRGRGLAYIRLDKAALAENDFRVARDLNNKEPENWMGIAVSLAMQKKIYESITIYEDLLRFMPNYVPGYIQLGRLQFKMGVISKGRDYYKKALNLRPTPEQRRVIEATLKEQVKLDQKRFYRPDFEQLRAQSATSGLMAFIKNIFSISKKKEVKVHL